MLCDNKLSQSEAIFLYQKIVVLKLIFVSVISIVEHHFFTKVNVMRLLIIRLLLMNIFYYFTTSFRTVVVVVVLAVGSSLSA